MEQQRELLVAVLSGATSEARFQQFTPRSRISGHSHAPTRASWMSLSGRTSPGRIVSGGRMISVLK